MRTKGSVVSSFLFNNSNVDYKLNIVPSNFPIPTDGILGKDFMFNFKADLSYNSMTFTVQTSNNIFESIPVYIEDIHSKHIVVPPRCEVVQSFRFQTDLKEDQVIHQQELAAGVFVARCVVSVKSPVIRILNTTDVPMSFDRTLNIRSENISNYEQLGVRPGTSPDRLQKLRSILKKNIKKCSSFSDAILSLCDKYNDIFTLEKDILTTNNFYTQKLNLSDKTPVYTKNYRMPHSQKQEVRSQVQNLLSNNLIEPSRSSYNSPILLVPKKSSSGEKKWRMCIDFRQLNKKLVPDKYPLPRIDDILDNLGRAKWFSTLDLFSGFFQIPLEEDSRKLTSFSTEDGSFQYKVLPFGLNIAPNSFARMMALAFSGLKPATCFLYLDDIIVIGVSEAHHLKNLESVFKTCRAHNLKLNPEKCSFLKSEVNYLGHICSDKGITPDTSKFSAISNYPTPTDKQATKRFVAIVNYYRRFIPNFASIAYPLNKLLRKVTRFKWTEECQTSFQLLKELLVKPHLLQYPKFDEEFIVTVDAAKYGVGAVLSQLTDGQDMPIAFPSKSFTKGELNKSTIEKEMTAIHFAITHFKPYLFGVKFLVRSDHRPLQYLFSLKDPSSKLSRMRLDLCDYNFSIEYLKGSDNVVADALSRVDFKVFKDLENQNAQILVLTRSKSRALAVPVCSEEPPTRPVTQAAVVVNNRDVSKIPHKVQFSISHSGTSSTISWKLLRKLQVLDTASVTGPIDNGNRTLESLFALLNASHNVHLP